MRLIRSKIHWLLFSLFLLLGAVFIFFLNRNITHEKREKQVVQLQNQHTRALDKFESSVDKFAGLAAGMRSYLNQSPDFPDSLDFQKFVNNQFNDINSEAPVVVSFIDTTHVFVQSFTRSEMNPANLVGKSVASLRSPRKIRMLDQMLKQDSLRVFPPLNLVEGWLGLPIDFRVRRNGKTVGYVAAIVDLKSIIDDIYKDAAADDFIFHFATEEGFDFDSEETYNNTKVYNLTKDPLYYKNFISENTEFVYSTVKFYGFEFKIGTAFKHPKPIGYFSLELIFWYIVFALIGALVTWQIGLYQRLNNRLIRSNMALTLRKEEMVIQNDELKRLNKTQNKFFSIIGHDIKQPLNAIEGLIYLLRGEKIKDAGLREVIEHLKESTRSTVDLLNNLLRWALSQTGDIHFNPVPIAIHKSINSIISYLKMQAQQKGVVIVHKFKEEIMYYGDQDMIDTIIRNLLSNAIKYSHSNSEVLITVALNEKTLELQIKDHGVGMRPETVANLFTLNEQISTTGTDGEKGTGLGLVLCGDFVKYHDGHINVESTVGNGTTFTINFPVTSSIKSKLKVKPPVSIKAKVLPN